jgi:hypothetical protein
MAKMRRTKAPVIRVIMPRRAILPRGDSVEHCRGNWTPLAGATLLHMALDYDEIARWMRLIAERSGHD